MPKVTPHLWFDKEAKEAAGFYVSAFKQGGIKSLRTLHNTPSGSVDILTIELLGQEFAMISAGPLFKFTPAVSFLVGCDSAQEVDALWKALSQGGTALMELGSYPFSERYGWLQDRYGLSWQIMHMGDRKLKQRIVPTLMFVGQQCGKAEEAMVLYTSVFPNSDIDHVMRYGQGEAPDKEGTVRHAGFTLDRQEFAAMDSAHEHNFTFNEAISFIVHCQDQKEIDYYWQKLAADPNTGQCGWIKDPYGVSWQIVPTVLLEMQKSDDQQKVARVTEAFLKMKKFDIEALKKAYEG
jgi:predicted 3-demethylubiquinone-9 3-methyltransferase (glyoxalase superfamily)